MPRSKSELRRRALALAEKVFTSLARFCESGDSALECYERHSRLRLKQLAHILSTLDRLVTERDMRFLRTLPRGIEAEAEEELRRRVALRVAELRARSSLKS